MMEKNKCPWLLHAYVTKYAGGSLKPYVIPGLYGLLMISCNCFRGMRSSHRKKKWSCFGVQVLICLKEFSLMRYRL